MRIFIAYGKGEGQKVGVKVNNYFKTQDYTSFLAAPKSPDVKSGENFQQDRIDPNLAEANAFIIIITPGMKFSKEVMKEIRYAIKNNIAIIPYVRGSTRPPQLLRKAWSPVRFPKGKGGQKKHLVELNVSMWGRLDSIHDWTTKPRVRKENAQIKSRTLRPKSLTKERASLKPKFRKIKPRMLKRKTTRSSGMKKRGMR